MKKPDRFALEDFLTHPERRRRRRRKPPAPAAAARAPLRPVHESTRLGRLLNRPRAGARGQEPRERAYPATTANQSPSRS